MTYPGATYLYRQYQHAADVHRAATHAHNRRRFFRQRQQAALCQSEWHKCDQPIFIGDSVERQHYQHMFPRLAIVQAVRYQECMARMAGREL